MSAEVSNRTSRPRLRIATSADRRIIQLLKQFPEVSPAEKAEIEHFIDSACPVEVQRLRADRTVQPIFDLLAKQRREALHGRAERISAAFLILFFVSTCWLLWVSM